MRHELVSAGLCLALLSCGCSPESIPATRGHVDTTFGREPTPVVSPNPTPTLTATPTETPTPTPAMLSVRVLDNHHAPWVDAIVASSLGDQLIDVSLPTDGNGETTVSPTRECS